MYNQHPYNAIMYNGVLYALRKAKASGSGVGTIITEPLIDILISSQGSGVGALIMDSFLEFSITGQGSGVGTTAVDYLMEMLPSGYGFGEGSSVADYLIEVQISNRGEREFRDGMYNQHKYNTVMYNGAAKIVGDYGSSGIGLGEGYGFILPLFSQYTKIMALLVREETLRARQKGEETLKASVKKP